MVARQFSQVVFRGLAVYVLISSISQINQLAMLYSGLHGAPPGIDFSMGQKVAATALWTVQMLIAAFLWTNAERFVGNSPDSQPSLRAGNWVVRLVFTAVGILICVYSMDNLVVEIANLIVPDPLRRDRSRDMQISAITEGLRFAVGLTLILAYRFDKAAIVSAAKAIEDTPV